MVAIEYEPSLFSAVADPEAHTTALGMVVKVFKLASFRELEGLDKILGESLACHRYTPVWSSLRW